MLFTEAVEPETLVLLKNDYEYTLPVRMIIASIIHLKHWIYINFWLSPKVAKTQG